MRYIILLSLIALACNSQQKLQKAKNRLSDNPLEAARFCSDKFPSKDSIVYRDTIILDTMYVGLLQVDTVRREDTIIIVKTSPSKIITKTITKVKETIKQPTEKIEEQRQFYLACEERYQKLFLKWEDAEGQKKSWKERFWWVIIVLAAFIGFIFRKPIMKIVGI